MSDRPPRKPNKSPGKPRGGRPDSVRARVDRAVSGAREPRPKGRPQRPPLRPFTTTLWEYPSQHYDDSLGNRMQGDKDYAGATPSWVIWQLLTRYTRENDVVVDPMCGSGTTLDVCADLGRSGVGFDLAPSRDDIQQADARELPLESASCDFAFVDPPYSTHIDYSDNKACIGKLDAGAPPRNREEPAGFEYYASMEEVIAELHRVLRPNRYMGLYVQDSWRKDKSAKSGLFMPIGFELFSIMRDYFEPVDIISVIRQNAKLQRGNWHKSALEGNYFLRGFNYLFIMKKTQD